MGNGQHASAAREASPYVELDRADWAGLAQTANDATEQPLTAEEIDRVRGLGDQLNLHEVQQVYLPLSRLLSLHETGPTHTVVIVRQLCRRSSGPVEIYLRIDAFLPEFIKVFAAEIAGTQATGLTVIAEQLPRRNRLCLVRSHIHNCDGGIIPEHAITATGNQHRNCYFTILLQQSHTRSAIVHEALLMLAQPIDRLIRRQKECLLAAQSVQIINSIRGKQLAAIRRFSQDRLSILVEK